MVLVQDLGTGGVPDVEGVDDVRTQRLDMRPHYVQVQFGERTGDPIQHAHAVRAAHLQLEVSCPDGVGVLYRITRAFAELDLDIVRAHVQTLGSDVVDAFYVRDASGAKILDEDHLAEIELSVLRWVAVDF